MKFGKQIQTMILISCLLVIGTWFLQGCDSDDPTDPAAGHCTVIIETEPKGLNLPWTLSGPNGYNLDGQGDQTLADLVTGQYTVNWGTVSGWTSPASSSQTLAADEELTFSGLLGLPPADDPEQLMNFFKGVYEGMFSGNFESLLHMDFRLEVLPSTFDVREAGGNPLAEMYFDRGPVEESMEYFGAFRDAGIFCLT